MKKETLYSRQPYSVRQKIVYNKLTKQYLSRILFNDKYLCRYWFKKILDICLKILQKLLCLWQFSILYKVRT